MKMVSQGKWPISGSGNGISSRLSALSSAQTLYVHGGGKKKWPSVKVGVKPKPGVLISIGEETSETYEVELALKWKDEWLPS